MHEAGIAAAVAAEIMGRGLDPAHVRLVVSGGHGDDAAFDSALRTHLAGVAPHLALDCLAIEHAPGTRICGRCAAPFEAALAADPCPVCGGPGIAVPQPERVELAWTRSDEGGAGEAVEAGVTLEEARHAHGVQRRGPVRGGPAVEEPDGGRPDDAWLSTPGEPSKEPVTMRRPIAPERP